MSNLKPKNIHNILKYLPELQIRLDYATKDNFTGEIVPGYEAKIPYLTTKAIKQLEKALKRFVTDGFNIIIFDTYRPLRAVNYFYHEWRLVDDNKDLKDYYYPNITKEDLFEIGYLSKRSTHCRASTIDMGLINSKTKELVNFGTPFDFFGEESHTINNLVSLDIIEIRNYFVSIMQEAHFKNYEKEWWHFTLSNEPYSNTYFDFTIKEYNE